MARGKSTTPADAPQTPAAADPPAGELTPREEDRPRRGRPPGSGTKEDGKGGRERRVYDTSRVEVLGPAARYYKSWLTKNSDFPPELVDMFTQSTARLERHYWSPGPIKDAITAIVPVGVTLARRYFDGGGDAPDGGMTEEQKANLSNLLSVEMQKRGTIENLWADRSVEIDELRRKFGDRFADDAAEWRKNHPAA